MTDNTEPTGLPEIEAPAAISPKQRPDMPRARELLPCPFCGGEAERIDFGAGDAENEGGSCIACRQCQSSGPVEFGRKESFVSNWNRRAAQRAAPEVTALRVAMETLDQIATADSDQGARIKASAAVAFLKSQPVDLRAAPEGWSFQRQEDGSIVVTAERYGAVHVRPDDSDSIAAAMLHLLASDMLAARPQEATHG